MDYNTPRFYAVKHQSVCLNLPFATFDYTISDNTIPIIQPLWQVLRL